MDDYEELQDSWYLKLKENGFVDIEDHKVGGFEFTCKGELVPAALGGRPLRSWSGISTEVRDRETGDLISIIDLYEVQPPLTEIQSNFPHTLFTSQDALTHHPDFQDICVSICNHGNHTLNPTQVKHIWDMHLGGGTCRGIARHMHINHVLVFRTVKALLSWSNLVGNDGHLD